MSITGAEAGGRASYSLTIAGDLDGDGLADAVVASPYVNAGGSARGMVSVYFSATLAPRTDYSTSQADVTILGLNDSGYLGWYMGAAGDVDNDGLDDLVIGTADRNVGDAWLFFGSTLVGGGTFTVAQADVLFDGVGSEAVGSAGDVDNDGFDDVLLMTSLGDTSRLSGCCEGIVSLFMGSDLALGGTFTPAEAFATFGGESLDQMAGAVAALGDIDGDGLGDFSIGNWAYGWQTWSSNYGVAYVMLGATVAAGGAYELSAADVRIVGSLGSKAGTSIAAVQDIDGDGAAELLVGAPEAWFGSGVRRAGSAHLFFSTTLLSTPNLSISSDADWSCVTSNATQWMGYSVSGAGDVDDDGLGDLVVGVTNLAFPYSSGGAVALFLGQSILPTSGADLWQADHLFTGAAAGDTAGFAVSGGGDVDGDGLDDLLLGSLNYSVGPSTHEGRAYILLSPY